jgi:hypothetical protein
MGYSIAKMIEFALSYLLSNELLLGKTKLPEQNKEIIINYFNERISQIRSEYK